MDSKSNTKFTNLKNENKIFSMLLEKLFIKKKLNNQEKTYLLSSAFILLNEFNNDNRRSGLVELAYSIILKYSIQYKEYRPLFDFSVDFGFFPIAKNILKFDLLSESHLFDLITESRLESVKHNNYFETLEQNINRNKIINNNYKNLSYIAPTSYGKSSIIVELLQNESQRNKIGIIVPKKSLLRQTYKIIKDSKINKKIILHDDMYENEISFVGILTQERAYRLMINKDVVFDTLFIDEAHNLFEKDYRNNLLVRLIKANKIKNQNSKTIFLSPLINNSDNLKVFPNEIIIEKRINFNIKEPNIYVFSNNKQQIYNRYLNEFYDIKFYQENFDYMDYIIKNKTEKNFIYHYRPIMTEEISKILYNHLDAIKSKKIEELISILKKYVNEDFKLIRYLEKGILYLHGKLPNIIKEYLEYKYSEIDEIQFLISNSVVLEGMNLPIDSLFILHPKHLKGNPLKNLIGRVNRLNIIFNSENDNLFKLEPPIHFVNSEKFYPKKFNSYITELRTSSKIDKIKNPNLENFNLESLRNSKSEGKQKEFKRAEKIIKYEEYILEIPKNEEDKIKQYLLQRDFNEFYSDIDLISRKLLEKINNNEIDQYENFLDKIYYLFLSDNIKMKDFEVARLAEYETRKFYKNYIKQSKENSLKENIMLFFKIFKLRQEKHINTREKIDLYIGESYGEYAKTTKNYSGFLKDTYIDLRIKSDFELINYAIIKVKLEDNFISNKLNKFIMFLKDYEIISLDEYNLYIYGTNDEEKIKLFKLGFHNGLVKRLEKVNQLYNLDFDVYGNLIANDDLKKYISSVDDFLRFEIERFL